MAKKINSGKNLRVIYLLGFFLSLSAALPVYIQSNFIAQFVSLQMVSFFYICSDVLTIGAMMIFPRIIARFKNHRLLFTMLWINFASLMFMAMTQSAFSTWIFFISIMLSTNLILINLDILVESFSCDASTGKTRGLYFTFMNLGWIIAPALSGWISGTGGYRLVYLISAIFLIPFYIVFVRHFDQLQDVNKYKKISWLKLLKKFIKNKDLSGIYVVATFLSLFYSLAVVYVPIHLKQNIGFSWNQLGLIFSFMLIPFIIFEIPAGTLADKYWGEKGLLFVGISVLIASVLLFFIVDSRSILVWGFILFFSRFGAAITESMRETYFFKKVDANDVGQINFFRSSTPLGYLIGTGLGVIILKFYAVEYIFLFSALILSLGYIFIYHIKDTK